MTPARLPFAKLLVLGGGFSAMAAIRRAAASGCTRLRATTRSEPRAEALRAAGCEAVVAPRLLADDVGSWVDESTAVLVTFPPDGITDAALAGAICGRAFAVAYVSSTGVYGNASGLVDETTPTDPRAPRAKPRLEAEAAWLAAGASVVRAPGIYGPGRGLHLRLCRGEVTIPGEGTQVISRIHVDDLAACLVALLALRDAQSLYVAGDDEPTPHRTVLAFLCERLGLSPPPSVPLAQADESLRHDRRAVNRKLITRVGVKLSYPTYREGFDHCIRADRPAIDAILKSRTSGPSSNSQRGSKS